MGVSNKVLPVERVETSVCIVGIIAHRPLARARNLGDNNLVISVDLDKIVTAKGLQAHLATILYEVEEEEKVYIVTKQGKPQAAIVNVDYLMELTGQKQLPTTEYSRYDQPKAPSAPVASLSPPQRPIEPAPTELTPTEPVGTPTPEPITPPTPPTPPPPQITDLERFSTEPEVAADEDPYAVADEQQIDLNGLPIKGQPDLSDGPANAPITTPPPQAA
jgi:prevent-host-death family protein